MSDLTRLEQRLVRCVEDGRVLDLTNGQHDASEKQMRAWGADRSVRASVIRDILRGKLAVDPDPRGINLRGARVVGHLDLRHLTAAVPLNLWSCLLAAGANFSWAVLKSVDFRRCRIRRLDLSATNVDGELFMSGATISNNSGPALSGEGLHVGGDLLMSEGFTATGAGEDGAVDLLAARVGGHLGAGGAIIRNDTGPAFCADRIQVGGNLFMDGRFTATGAGEDGAVRLPNARLGGLMIARGATVSNDSGPALYADGLQVASSLFLDEGFAATGTGEVGAVRLASAHVGGQMIATSATISNDSGPALHADSLQVGGNLLLDQGFTATGAGQLGAVRLLGVRVGGELVARGATISNGGGPALHADGLQVEGTLFIDEEFIAVGAGEAGAVRLLGARVGGQLLSRGATISSDSGPALYADGLQVGEDLFLGKGFTATGAGELGAVRLLGARVGGQLTARSATVSNDSGPAFVADNLEVRGDLFLDAGFIAISGAEHAALVLIGAHVGGLSLDLTGVLDASGTDGKVALDGLVYQGLPQGLPVADWLVALAYRTPYYSAQPYQQLATATRAAGHDGDTRRILMAQRRDQIRRRAITAFPERIWASTTGILLGFGYQPWRALLYLVGVLAVSVTLTIFVGGHGGGLSHAALTTSPNTACSTMEQIGVAIDLGLPLIKTAAGDSCHTTPTTEGQIITAAGWVLQLLAWALATLFIAGFTGVVRKT